MKNNVAQFFKFFFIQMMSYGLITWNYRAIAMANYVNVGVSDLMFAAVNFSIIKQVGEAKSKMFFGK